MTSLTQTPKSFPVREFIKLTAASAGVVVVLALLGYFPTLRFYGDDGVPAMLVGLAVASVATLVGLIPGLKAANASGQERHQAILIGMLIRLVLIVLIGAAAALSGFVPYRPLLIWLAIGYLALLFVDTLAMYSLFTRDDAEPTQADQPSVENTAR